MQFNIIVIGFFFTRESLLTNWGLNKMQHLTDIVKCILFFKDVF